MTTKTKGTKTNTKRNGTIRKAATGTKKAPAAAAAAPRGTRKAGFAKSGSTQKSARQSAASRSVTTTTSRVKSKAPKAGKTSRSTTRQASPKKTPKSASKSKAAPRSMKVTPRSRRDEATVVEEIAMTSVAPEMAEAMLEEMNHGGEEEAMAREAAREEKARDILGRLAVAMNRHDDMPNQELAANIVFHLDEEAVSILVGIIERGDDVHAPDAARVLCEVGSRDHELLLPVADRLVAVCEHGMTPMLPFAMYALSPVAHRVAEQLWEMRDLFWQVLSESEEHAELGQAASVRLLSALCAAGPDYARTLAGGLVDLLGKCLPKDVALYAESVLPALGAAHSHRAKPVLDRRMKELTPAEVARLRRAVRAAQSGQSLYPAAA